MKHILAVDLGTTSMKAALFGEEMRLRGEVKIDYATDYPAPGWAEQDAEAWWAALKEAGARLYSGPGAPSPADLEMIAVDAMAPTLVPVDSEGRALRRSIIWMDRRAQEESRLIGESLGERVFSIGGNVPDASCPAPKIRWIREHEPEIYRRTRFFLGAGGFIVRRLTGKASMDITQCGLSGLWDSASGGWSDTLIDGSALDGEKLPEIFECTDCVGELTREAARELGLPRRVRVIAGAMDNAAAVLGSGAAREGELCISAGTAANVNLCRGGKPRDPAFLVYRHIVPGLWIQAGSVDGGGAGYQWFASLIDESDFSALDRLAEAAGAAEDVEDVEDVGAAGIGEPPFRPLIFLPFMTGQRAPLWNSRTRGVLFGLSPSTSRGEIARALMEGNAMGIRGVLELMGPSSLSGGACRLTGGCARSAVYSQVFADMLGLDILRMDRGDTALRGAALAAATAAGWIENFQGPPESLSAPVEHKPSPGRAGYRREAYELFKRLYDKLEDEFEALGQLTRAPARGGGPGADIDARRAGAESPRSGPGEPL